ncbi:ParB/RepB/Spo0J family partition protein [Acidisoma silvae]|uniref:ParB/RepB/Spo0J family partition protein n=1 Tax=Acidisoma silvae TaxID=2802396 RepID=A0A963YR49_9PROT|nr:ParB/RepB/Spo0J family partition protein [Acidisoma silvae]MCB8875467.1 ParB/RepB/Spo0J family partition protein [Acidisoma silvae]
MSARDAGPRLGRGLAALLGEDSSAAPRSAAIQHIALDLLTPGPFQPRTQLDPSELAALAASIREQGVLQPILARPDPANRGHFQIIAGERRWRASQQAGLHEIPALVRDLEDTAAMAAALVENLQREDLNPIDEGEGYRRLMEEFSLTQERVADSVGKSRSHIANTVRLLKLPSAVQIELRRGSISAGHARALLTHPDPAKAALAVIAQGLNVRQTEALTARQGEDGTPKRREAPSKDADTRMIERELEERLGLAVSINARGRGGSLQLQYKSFEQLEGLIALLMQR